MTLKPAMSKDIMKRPPHAPQTNNSAAGRWLNPVSEVGIGKKSKGKI